MVLKSAKFAHSIVDQLAAVGLQEPPADKAALKTLLDLGAVAKFTTKAKPGQVAVKPTMAPLAYLQQPLRGARANQKAFAAALTRLGVPVYLLWRRGARG
mgnify:CR=1 FL=1